MTHVTKMMIQHFAIQNIPAWTVTAGSVQMIENTRNMKNMDIAACTVLIATREGGWTSFSFQSEKNRNPRENDEVINVDK